MSLIFKKGGRLINASTTVMPLSNDSSTMFPDRYKVLQKMILLMKMINVWY